jgi:hypothetical protein
MTYEAEIGERGNPVRGKYPNDISINHLASAVGVIVYDAGSKKSFSIRVTSPDVYEDDKLDEMLNEAASEFEGSESVVVMATGACIGSELGPAEAWQKRNHIDQVLSAAFPRATMNVLWPPDGVESTSITLDSQSGEVRFDHQSVPVS